MTSAIFQQQAIVTKKVLSFDRTVPAVLQRPSPWTCSACATTWLLNAYGIPVSKELVTEQLVGMNAISPGVGLHYGDGRDLVTLLKSYYGLPAHNQDIDWGGADQMAKERPFIMGSTDWYHWSGVRSKFGDSALLLANPAPGHMGVWDALSSARFNELAPWSGLWIE